MATYSGYYGSRYQVNRKLTAEERKYQLHQKERLDIAPFDALTVIRMNSTYLESIDRWFLARGLFVLLGLVACIGFFSPIVYGALSENPADWNELIFFSWAGAPVWGTCAFSILLEAFHRTHYPIRFNHHTKMVYAFKLNGKIIRAKWDDIFFTLVRGKGIGYFNWDIRGHILDEHGTVVETFALPYDCPDIKVEGGDINKRELMHVWEFYRRYMEEGPESIYPHVRWCHDVASRREKYRVGLRYVFYEIAGWTFGKIIAFPFYFLLSIARWITMHTSRIPKWPEDIEAECRVDQNDPYIKDAASNPARIPTVDFRTWLKEQG